VIDSLTGFEIALAAPFRDDLRDSLYRLIGSLTSLDITVLSTMEMSDATLSMQFTPYNVSFLTDDIIVHRYVELHGQLQKIMAVVKMRGSDHSRELRAYDITSRGIVIGETLSEYRGLITGVPEPRFGERERPAGDGSRPSPPGPT
jgi:circadian clock protein KaiC